MQLEIIDVVETELTGSHLFDQTGFLMISFFILLLVYERYRAHSSTAFPTTAPLKGHDGVVDRIEKTVYWQWFQSNKLFESYVTRRSTLC